MEILGEAEGRSDWELRYGPLDNPESHIKFWSEALEYLLDTPHYAAPVAYHLIYLIRSKLKELGRGSDKAGSETRRGEEL